METKFPERLKELRQQKGVSQREIAKAVGVSQTGFLRWEQGKNQPTLENLMELCKYFDVSVDYLIGYTDI